VGASPAGDDGLSSNQSLPDVLQSCGSWLASDDNLPANQSLPAAPQSNCRSQPAGDDDLPANQSLPAAPIQLWEPALLAMTAFHPTNPYQMYSNPVGAGLPAMAA
jgi:hypothetical protein